MCNYTCQFENRSRNPKKSKLELLDNSGRRLSHNSHFFVRFITNPPFHWKSLGNSFRLLNGPMTQNRSGEWVSDEMSSINRHVSKILIILIHISLWNLWFYFFRKQSTSSVLLLSRTFAVMYNLGQVVSFQVHFVFLLISDSLSMPICIFMMPLLAISSWT